jgi:hypothetical protein
MSSFMTERNTYGGRDSAILFRVCPTQPEPSDKKASVGYHVTARRDQTAEEFLGGEGKNPSGRLL